MDRHQRPPRLESRKIPYGRVNGLIGEEILCADGSHIPLGPIFGSTTFFQSFPTGYNLIHDLVGEIIVLRKLLAEVVRERGPRIMEPNDFHRSMTSLAGKIDEHPADVRAVVEPLIRQLFDQMLEPRKLPETGRERGNRDRREFIRAWFRSAVADDRMHGQVESSWDS